ncbi:MAG TPA: matrixin family metalloprotease [Gemmatimonadaceae bacterium]|nr:matrixin family metalloprotease [Gemmatimonadaceae bacterium]
MALLLGVLTSVATIAAAAAPIAQVDSVKAAACPALAQAGQGQPRVAEDVHAALAAHGVVVRWDPTDGPIRVWVQPKPSPTMDWNSPPTAWREAVLDAARSWRGIVPGLELAAASDSASADVTVTWVDAHSLAGNPSPGFASGTAGRTELTDLGGRATTARVRLAVTSGDGIPLQVVDVRAVARHEFGHVLGLAHHAAARSVMAARVQTERLHAGDAAALRLLYALPIGARCDVPRQVATRTTPAAP